MNKKIGFIGCGNMAQAMIKGILKKGIIDSNDVFASASSMKNLTSLKEEYNINVTLDNQIIAQQVDYLILAVKPNMYETIIQEIKDTVQEHTVIISIAAGITIDYIHQSFQKDVKIVRTMPNTPSLVNEGMTAITFNKLITSDEQCEIIELFESFGQTIVINEILQDAIPAVSGSSPAYVFMMIEAMADASVLQGIPRDLAYKLAAQAILGAAKMVLETNIHPGQLKDNVCSPGGTTIEAVTTLEAQGFRSSIISAMNACTTKAKQMKR